MKQVCDILQSNSTGNFTLDAQASALQASIVMRDHQSDAMVITDGDEVVGVLRASDLVHKLLAEDLDPHHTPVRDLMSQNVVYGSSEMDVESVRRLMASHRMTDLPVINQEGYLVGMVNVLNIESASRDQTLPLDRWGETAQNRPLSA